MTTELNATEVLVSKVWAELLNVSDIGPEQSFFDLGGDSLLMIDMLVRVGQETGTEIDASILFEEGSLRGFSALIAQQQGAGMAVEETI